MGLFAKFKAGLQKTHSKLAHEIKRIVTRSPKLDAAGLEELEGALLAADLGPAVSGPVSYTHLRAHETPEHLVCRLLLEKKNKHHKLSINPSQQSH